MEYSTEELTEKVCQLLSAKKATDIVVADISEQTIVAERFVICSARSTTQVKALTDAVDEGVVLAYEEEPLRVEGKREGRWSVLDYGAVVVHIFLEETRNLYSLEKLWGTGKNITEYAAD